jgi:hypothetical protein
VCSNKNFSPYGREGVVLVRCQDKKTMMILQVSGIEKRGVMERIKKSSIPCAPVGVADF